MALRDRAAALVVISHADFKRGTAVAVEETRLHLSEVIVKMKMLMEKMMELNP